MLPEIVPSFLARLDKDVKGSLTAILILAIVMKEKTTWGYRIKKELTRISKGRINVKDSTLYTTLNSLEKFYKLLISVTKDRRRYYSLSEHGQMEIHGIFRYWDYILKINSQAFIELGIS